MTKLVHDVDFFVHTDARIIEPGQFSLQVHTKKQNYRKSYLYLPLSAPQLQTDSHLKTLKFTVAAEVETW